MKLTETDLSIAQYDRGNPYLPDGNELYLYISENGTKSFQRRHTQPFEPEVWIAMGRYGDELTLKEARDLNVALKKVLEDGYHIDNVTAALARNSTPDGIKRLLQGSEKTKPQRRGPVTFQQMHTAWHAQLSQASRRLALNQNTRRNIVIHFYPHIAKTMVEKVSETEIKRLLTPLWVADKATASNVKNCLSSIFDLAASGSYRLITSNPASFELSTLDQAARPTTDPEKIKEFENLPRLWSGLTETAQKSPLAIGSAKLLLLTAQHSAQVAAMRWKDIDLETGIWHFSYRVNDRQTPTHRLPLSVLAQSILLELSEITGNHEFVFHSPKTATGHLPATHLDKICDALLKTHSTQPHDFHDLLTAWAAEAGYAANLFFERGWEDPKQSSDSKKAGRMIAALRVIMQHWADYLTGAAFHDEKNRV